MGELKVDVDPAEVGFDAGRLTRIDTHFQRYVDDGRLPGWLALVTRHGQVVHVASSGYRDVAAGLPIELDTLFRIYSMSKPVTSVAAMMLYEEGGLDLKEPIHRFIPSFRGARVFRGGSALQPVTEPMTEPIRVWHLLTHTSGLSYGFHYAHPVDAMYRAAGFEWSSPKGEDLEAVCDRLAALPLVFQPGTGWNYSMSTDVLGRVVEVVSGQTLDAFMKERIFDPLGMNDTSFWVEEPDHERLAELYLPEAGTRKAVATPMGKAAKRPPYYLGGGGGLVSTAPDYHRFTEMLRRRGELDGVRILGSRTVDYMTRNHLPGNVDLEEFGQSTFAETSFDGVGFGLGFSVVDDPVAYRVLAPQGEYGWGGAASTAFWVDPANDMTVSFFTQLLPSSTHPIRPELHQLVYQALVD